MRFIALGALLLAACQPPVAPAPAPASLRCGTPLHLGEIRDRLALSHKLPLERKADGPPALREPFGTFPNPILSAHFALKWGPDATVDPALGQRILAGLETALGKEVTEMGLAPPSGLGSFYVNVYVGNSGGGAPDIPFEGAYVSVDPDGYSFITLHPVLLETPPEYTDEITAHELFHTVQVATGLYVQDHHALGGSWYWEATAEWAATEVHPAATENAVGAYAILPYVSLNYIDYPDEQKLIEFHHYGAAIFPRYLTERFDWTLVRDTWKSPPDPRDPLRTIDTFLAARGTNLEDAFIDFAAHNVVWDYQRGSAYRDLTEEFASAYRTEDASLIRDLPPTGLADDLAPKARFRPWGYGYNTYRVRSPRPGPWRVALKGEATGTEGSAANWRAMVVHDFGGSFVYEPVAMSGHEGALTVEATRERNLFLVVAAQPRAYEPEEPFGYTARLEGPAQPDMLPPPGVDMSEEPPAGSGCSLAGRAPIAAPWLTGLLLLVLVRRRWRTG